MVARYARKSRYKSRQRAKLTIVARFVDMLLDFVSVRLRSLLASTRSNSEKTSQSPPMGSSSINANCRTKGQTEPVIMGTSKSVSSIV
jgi:hypothetical protein